jgi:hypothetical protein
MPYPSPTTYPSGLLFPGVSPGRLGDPVALGETVLNSIDANGVHWILEEFSGWDSPGSSLSLTQRARGHGATGSEAFFKPRVMTLSGKIIAPSVEAGRNARDELYAAVELDPFRLAANEEGLLRHCSVQRQDQVLAKRIGKCDTDFSVQVVAKDPRKFGDLVSLSTPLPSSSGGLTYPLTYPKTYTGVSKTGKVIVTNPGNTQAPVWLRVDGPIPAGGWTVTHVGKKQALTFASSLALTSGEFVTVDMDRREVLAQGQSARSGYVTSRGWFSLDPGDNEIAFSAANYSATAQLTVTTKPAWA